MKKVKWIKSKDVSGCISYSVYLPKKDYRVALINKKSSGGYWLKVPYIEVESKDLFVNLNDAKIEAIKRLKQISEDLNKMFNEQTT